MQTLLNAIEESDDSTEIDAMFCILRDRKIGIKKKLLCLALILGLEDSEIIDEAPKDANGRILDHQSRHIISESLVKASQKNKN
jgi:hypothetical protein